MSEKIETQKLTAEESEELRSLRRRQVSGPWSEQDRQRLLQLSAKEETADTPLSPQERAEYTELTKRQTAGANWTPADADRLRELQHRVDRELAKKKFL